MCPKKYGAMLIKMELAKKIIKRRKKRKDCKTLRIEPGAMCYQLLHMDQIKLVQKKIFIDQIFVVEIMKPISLVNSCS